MKRRMKIHQKVSSLIISFNLIMLVIFSLAFYSFESYFNQSRLDAVQELLDVISGQKKLILANELFSFQKKAIIQSLEDISLNKRIIGAEVLTEKGNVIAFSGLFISSQLKEKVSTLSKQESQFIRWEYQGQWIASYIDRIDVNNEIYGILVIHYDLSAIETNAIIIYSLRFLVILIIILITQLLLKKMLNRDVILPIHLLRNNMKNTKIGVTSEPTLEVYNKIHNHYAEEIMEIIDTFDSMSLELEQQHTRLREQNKRIAEESELRQEQQKALLNIRDEVETKERQHVSEKLHDGIGQNLQAIKLGLQFLRSKNCKQSQSGTKMLNELIADTSETIQQVRSISSDIRPAYQDGVNIVKAIHSHCQRMGGRTALKFNIEHEQSSYELNDSKKKNLFFVIQEFINNTIKHANADCVSIKLFQEKDLLVVVLSDDGIGFDPQEPSNIDSGLGLRLMAERIRSIDGHFTQKSSIKTGAYIQISINLDIEK